MDNEPSRGEVMDMAFRYRCPAFVKESLDAIAGDERFVMAIAIGAANYSLCVMGFLTGGEYITGLSLIFGSYALGKSGERIAESNASARIAVATGVMPDQQGTSSSAAPTPPPVNPVEVQK